jgi:hypothetical protein
MFHEFSVPAKRRHDEVVTRRRKAAVVHPVRRYTTILHQQTNWKRLKTSRGGVPPHARQDRTSN